MTPTESMIDLHSHFLPGIDDGSQSVEESLGMLTESKRQGVVTCVATPHCTLHRPDDLERFLMNRSEAFKKLKAAAAGSDIPEIFLGGEVYLDNNILKNYDGIERLCISGTDYILVELPRRRLDKKITELIFNLSVKGMKPILAHVERADGDELDEIGIWDLDIIFQVNAESFLNFSSRRRLKKIFAAGGKFVTSSDMHNTDTRPPCMLEARNISKNKFPGLTDELFYINAGNILKTAHL